MHVLKQFYSNAKLRVTTASLSLLLFCVLLQYCSSIYGLLISQQVEFSHQGDTWIADVSAISDGQYYVSAGRPRGLCNLNNNGKVIATTKSSDGRSRESLMLGASFEQQEANTREINIQCVTEGGFGVSLMHTPIIASYKSGMLLQLWRSLTELALGPFFSFLLLLVILLMMVGRGTSSELFNTDGRLSVYLAFSLISFVYSLSLAYYTRLFLDGLSASLLHIVLRTAFNISFLVVVGQYSRHRIFSLMILVISCAAELTTALITPTYFDRMDNFALSLLPVITLFYVGDLLKIKSKNRFIFGMTCLVLTRFLLQIIDAGVALLNVGVYLAPSALAVITMTVLILKIVEDNVASKKSIEAKIEAERNLTLTDSRLKAMTKTAQMVAHDIRRPLSALNNLIDEIRDLGLLTDRGYLPRLDATKHMVFQAQGITEDMIAVGKATKPSLDRTTCTVEKIVTNALSYQSFSQATEPKLSGDFFTKLFVDEVKIERVISNIVENAIHATGTSGSIWIRCDTQANHCTIIIGNSGSLIAADIGNRLFDPFFTLGKKGGTGLGLAISKSIVEAHDGSIWFQSTEATGTEFFIQLPLQSNASFAIHEHATSEIRSKLERIANKANRCLVIVEDDPFILEQWHNLNKGWNIVTFTRPEKFIKWMEENDRPIDVFIFDYYFDGLGMTGDDLARTIKSDIRESAAVILCSDHRPTEEETALYDLVIAKNAIAISELFKSEEQLKRTT